ncbi:MAG TPA: lipocalin family protein, partial [Nitrospirota bacterium]|nr:lipocalin family protein [Nitrospirota bacterium]
MNARFILVAVCMLFCSAVSCASPKDPSQLVVVPRVDLARYAGTWYEIASFPQRFQKGCSDTRAVYTVRGDGKIDV